jgi:lysozyme
MRRVNKTAVDLIKGFEGLRLKPYLDAVGIPTIGYGTIMYPDGKKVSLSDPEISEAKSLEYLEYEVNKKASAVEKMVSVPLNDNEFGALVSFAYNVGVGALQKSTLLKFLNASQDRVAVADQLLRWNKAGGKELPGLTRRRQAERSLFLNPVAPAKNKSHLPDGPSDEDISVKLDEIEKDILKK